MIFNERGLTLAEILVAIAVIGLGLVGLAVVVPVSSYGVQEGNQLSTATFLAEQRVEQARNARWVSTPAEDCLGFSAAATEAPTIPAGGACTNPVGAAGAITFADEAAIAGFAGYTRNTRVTNCGATPCAGVTNAAMRLVQVTVTYRPLTGAGVSPTLKTVRVEWLVAQR
jgi:prepilin-type N-terminal cleavage/methylation domain-containing protein